MHIVCKREYRLGVAVVILHSDLGNRITLLSADVNNVLVNDACALFVVKILGKLPYTALVHKGLAHRLLTAVIGDAYTNACVEKSLLTQAVFDHLVVKLDRLEYIGIGPEFNVKTVKLGIPRLAKLLYHVTALKRNGIALSVTVVFDLNTL